MAKALARDRYGVGRYRSDSRPIDKGPKELAQIIEDTRLGKRYLRGRFLGKVRECEPLILPSSPFVLNLKCSLKTLLFS